MNMASSQQTPPVSSDSSDAASITSAKKSLWVPTSQQALWVLARLRHIVADVLNPWEISWRRIFLAWWLGAAALPGCWDGDPVDAVTSPTVVRLSAPNIPSEAVAGTQIEISFQYVPLLTTDPVIILDKAPVWVIVASQVYDKASWKMTVTLMVSPAIDPSSVINASIQTVSGSQIVAPLIVKIPIKPGKPKLISWITNQTGKQGWRVTYTLQFDRMVESVAPITWANINIDPLTNRVTVDLPVGSTIGSSQVDLTVNGKWWVSTLVPLMLNVTDGVAPVWINTWAIPSQFSQWESRKITLAFNEPLVGAPTLSAWWSWSLPPWGTLSPDLTSYTFTIKASTSVSSPQPFTFTVSDVAWNTVTYTSTIEVVDTEKPTLTLLATPPALTNSAVAVFTIWSSERLSQIGYKLDGADMIVVPGGAMEFTIPANLITSGTHTIEIRWYDTSGNLSSLQYAWKVDNTAPVLNPTSSQSTIIQDVSSIHTAYSRILAFSEPLGSVNWTQSDGSGITLGNIGISTTDRTQVTYQLTVAANTPPWTHIVNVQVTDPAWNITITPISVMIDAPTVVSEISGPDSLAPGEPKSYSLTASDADGVIVSAQLQWTSLPVNMWGWIYIATTPANLQPGNYTLTFTIQGKKPDGTLAQSVTKTKNIVVATALPTLPSTIPLPIISDNAGDTPIVFSFVMPYDIRYDVDVSWLPRIDNYGRVIAWSPTQSWTTITIRSSGKFGWAWDTWTITTYTDAITIVSPGATWQTVLSVSIQTH